MRARCPHPQRVPVVLCVRVDPGKGGKSFKSGKNRSEEKRDLEAKDEGQEYAKVLKMLGNGRLEAHCYDGVQRLCHIRGKMRKQVWVAVGDIVLVSLREYQDCKADVIMKYTAEEARELKKRKWLPDNVKINDPTAEGDAGADGDGKASFEFADFDEVDVDEI